MSPTLSLSPTENALSRSRPCGEAAETPSPGCTTCCSQLTSPTCRRRPHATSGAGRGRQAARSGEGTQRGPRGRNQSVLGWGTCQGAMESRADSDPSYAPHPGSAGWRMGQCSHPGTQARAQNQRREVTCPRPHFPLVTWSEPAPSARGEAGVHHCPWELPPRFAFGQNVKPSLGLGAAFGDPRLPRLPSPCSQRLSLRQMRKPPHRGRAHPRAREQAEATALDPRPLHASCQGPSEQTVTGVSKRALKS